MKSARELSLGSASSDAHPMLRAVGKAVGGNRDARGDCVASTRAKTVLAKFVCAHWRSGLLAGVLVVSGSSIALFAMSIAPIAPVVALPETSVVFAVCIGSIFLGEGFGARAHLGISRGCRRPGFAGCRGEVANQLRCFWLRMSDAAQIGYQGLQEVGNGHCAAGAVMTFLGISALLPEHPELQFNNLAPDPENSAIHLLSAIDVAFFSSVWINIVLPIAFSRLIQQCKGVVPAREALLWPDSRCDSSEVVRPRYLTASFFALEDKA